MNIIFFDTETTGLKPGNICQLSYILVNTDVSPNSTIGKNFFFTVDYIEPSAEKVHGFSVEDLNKLSSGKHFKDRLKEFFTDFQNADILIGHNVNFDIKFLLSELETCGKCINPSHIFCTMKYYKDICNLKNSRNELKAPKLKEVVKFLNIEESYIKSFSKKLFKENGSFHDARFDATATYLLVREGIKKGYIPPKYFSKMLSQ